MTDSFWERFLEFDIRSRRRMRGGRLTPLSKGSLLLGDTPQACDRLLAEVISGRKTALIMTLYSFQESGRSIPKPEEYRVLLNGRGEEKCVIRSTGVHFVTYRGMSEEYAMAEGYDRSLREWQIRSRERFLKECSMRGMPFSMELPLVVDTFTVAYWEE